jgi:hypothetical protein
MSIFLRSEIDGILASYFGFSKAFYFGPFPMAPLKGPN